MSWYFCKRAVSALKKRELWLCGIIGFIGNESSRDYLLEGLEILRNRGYDSAGISTVANVGQKPSLTTTKFASVSTSDSFDLLKEATDGKHMSFCGIGHTRWATHGAITDANAHPHCDTDVFCTEINEKLLKFSSFAYFDSFCYFLAFYLFYNFFLI